MQLFEHFDRVRIVSLASRLDRRRNMLATLKKAAAPGQTAKGNANEKIRFFDVYRMDSIGPFQSIGEHGCYLSHMEVLKQAAEAKQSVLIMEDDCEFISGGGNYCVPDDCEIIYGGCFDRDGVQEDPKSDDLGEIAGAHCMGYSAQAADKAYRYLQQLLDPAFPPDPTAAAVPGFRPEIRPPFDGALVWFRRAHPELKTRFHRLSFQRSSRMDIGQVHALDRFAFLSSGLRLARHVKSSFRRAVQSISTNNR